MTKDEMKKLWDSGDYECVLRDMDKCSKVDFKSFSEFKEGSLLKSFPVIFVSKTAQNGEHIKVLDAFLADNDVEIIIRGEEKKYIVNDFIESYDENYDYRLKYENGGIIKPKESFVIGERTSTLCIPKHNTVTDFTNTYCEATQLHFKELDKLQWKDGKTLLLPHYKYFCMGSNYVDTTNFLIGKNLKQIHFNTEINKWVYTKVEEKTADEILQELLDKPTLEDIKKQMLEDGEKMENKYLSKKALHFKKEEKEYKYHCNACGKDTNGDFDYIAQVCRECSEKEEKSHPVFGEMETALNYNEKEPSSLLEIIAKKDTLAAGVNDEMKEKPSQAEQTALDLCVAFDAKNICADKKPLNNFKDYISIKDKDGKEYKFVKRNDVKLLSFFDDRIFGAKYIQINSNIGQEEFTWVAEIWDTDGSGYDDDSHNLTPIKKEWYEDKNNFPVIVCDEGNSMFLIWDKLKLKELEEFSTMRRATDEEIDSLKRGV